MNGRILLNVPLIEVGELKRIERGEVDISPTVTEESEIQEEEEHVFCSLLTQQQLVLEELVQLYMVLEGVLQEGDNEVLLVLQHQSFVGRQGAVAVVGLGGGPSGNAAGRRFISM